MMTALPVYLIHWNAPAWCAASVGTIVSSDIDVRVTIIDNGGGPVQLPKGVNLLPQAVNRGYTGGANVALQDWLRHHDEEWCVIGSHDLHVERSTFSTMLAAGISHRDGGVLGPHYTGEASSGGSVFRTHRDAEERQWISGTCLMIRRECAQQVGPFDERFGSYVEDVDFCLRAWDAGWSVLSVLSARAHGMGAASNQHRVMRYENSVLLATKRRGARAGIAAVASQFALAGWHIREALRRESNISYELRAAGDRLRAVPGGARHVYRSWRTTRGA